MNRWTLDEPEDFVVWVELPGKTVEIVDIQVGSIRGVGRGRELVNRVVSEARDLGAKLVFAKTRHSNRIACEFYSKVGFTSMGVLKGFYRDSVPPDHALVFGLNL